MKEINRAVLEDAANRLLFTMSDEEYRTLENEFSVLTALMSKFGEIDGLSEFEPMTFPFPCETSYLREDVATTPLTKEEVLRNAGNTQDGQIKLPKVVL